MFDLPLHPLIVHFPLVLAVILPLATLGAMVAGFRTKANGKYWAAAVLINTLLLGSSFLAVQTGERDEEMVEKALASESPLETHEEMGEFFLKMTGVSLAVMALGLAPGVFGISGKVLGGLASVAILALGMQVGHSGGSLVYKHGAATAFTANPGSGGISGAAAPAESSRREAGEVGEED